MSLIHYATPQIADAAEEIARVQALTAQNHQHSLAIVTRNADNFGGHGSDAFKQAITLLNHHYDNHTQVLQAAQVALHQMNTEMTQKDLGLAAQYNV